MSLLASVFSRTLRPVWAKPTTAFAQVQREVTFYIDTDHGVNLEMKMKHFAIYGEQMGSDPYPNHRKEHMKRKEVRFLTNNKRAGKLANYKVRSLVDFINFKKAHNYR